MKSLETIQKAVKYMETHKKAVEKWHEGAITEFWKDIQGNLCIKYESGKWWHYRTSEDGRIEWF